MSRYCPQCHEKTDTEDQCTHCGAPTVLESAWVLEDFLGHGASGYTWRARHIESGEHVAIKELSFRKMTDLKQLELFEREADALRSIDDPNVPEYRDQFVVEGDRFVSAYLVQELIEGEALDTVGRVDEDQVWAWMLELSETLDVLHGMRPAVIHRDIKPSNIMRREDGRLVLIDFGAIRAAAQASVGGSTIAGTMGYMAPEQLLGKAEPASDYYALGATAVALLAGKDASDLIDPHEPRQWRKRVDVSDELGDVLEQLLQPKSADRLSSHESLRAARKKRAEPSGPSLGERLRGWFASRTSSERQAKETKVRPDRWAAFTYVTVAAAGVMLMSLIEPAALQVFVVTTGTSVFSVFYLMLWLGVIAAIPTLALAGWNVPGFRTYPLRIWAAVAAAAVVALSWWVHTPSNMRPNLSWFGERDGVLQRAHIYGDDTGCILIRSHPDVDDLIGVTSMLAYSDGECPELEVTDYGSVWAKIDGERPRLQLVDLWTGDVLWTTNKLEFDSFKVGEFQGEQVELELPDGSKRVEGITRPAELQSGMTKFVKVTAWVYSADLPAVDGFRMSTFTRDRGCGILTYGNTTKFGPGEWRLTQRDPRFGTWTKSVRELVGAEALDGVFVAPDQCWLATKDQIHRLDARTAETSDVLKMH